MQKEDAKWADSRGCSVVLGDWPETRPHRCGRPEVAEGLCADHLAEKSPAVTACGSTRYSIKPCSESPPKFRVVYFDSKGAELDTHPACFVHGLAEVDRHHASGGIAAVELRPE